MNHTIGINLTGIFILAGLLWTAAPDAHAETKDMWCYIGTTASDPPHQSKGIYLCRFDSTSGKLTEPVLVAETPAPSFLALHPGGRFLYACREGSAGTGACAFEIDHQSGALKLINEQPTGGKGNCFVQVDATGKALTVANYQSGSFASLPIASDGSLQAPATTIQDHGGGPFPKRQDGPHAHSFNIDPSNRFVIGCDLGNDELPVFRLDPSTAKLTAIDSPVVKAPAGNGPRHVAFHPNHKFVYVINELASTVTVFSWDADRGRLAQVQDISTLPADFKGESWAAEVSVSSDGRFLYGSNRGDDSIAIFSVDSQTGRLTLLGFQKTGGKWPRHFAIDPTGQWLIAANEHTHDLFVLGIDAATGALSAPNGRVEVPSPSCVVFLK
jgi:6-phosphogluconolactonase